MEWSFLFRVDYLRQQGEERNLKGLLYTKGDLPPTAAEIEAFLRGCGYAVSVYDEGHLVFRDNHPDNPVEIRIVRMGKDQEAHNDAALRTLIDQFRRAQPPIG